jgi:hypothetical protein
MKDTFKIIKNRPQTGRKYLQKAHLIRNYTPKFKNTLKFNKKLINNSKMYKL